MGSGANPSRRKLLRTCGKFLAALPVWSAACSFEHQLEWVAFYGESADEQLLSSYDIVVLDPAFRGSIGAVGESGAIVCAYLSLGEVSKSNRFFGHIQRAALLDENPAWPGTYRIDVRQPSWKRLVLAEIIPYLVERGFTGLMLDTLDTPPYLEQLDPGGNRGMRQAATDLVKSVRRKYHNLFLIVNRGYAIISAVAGSIDSILAESLLTSPGPAGGYRWNSLADVSLQLSFVDLVRNRRPQLPILSLDYWNPDDVKTIREIYRRERLLGHSPYVATEMLNVVFPEPPPGRTQPHSRPLRRLARR